MKFERTHQYSIDFESGWITPAAFFAGVAILSRVIYYFVLSDIAQIGAGEMILSLILPLLWLFGYVAILRGVHLNHTFVFAVFAAVYCIFMMIWAFQYGSALKGVLSILWYLILGGGFVVSVLGYFDGRYYLAAGFGISFLLQTLIVDLNRYIVPLDFKGYLPQLAMISGVASLAFFCLALRKKSIN